MEDKKPAFVPRQARDYGEAKEVNISKAERERQEVGLTPDEVREINKPGGQSKFEPKSKLDRAAKVFAASLTAAAGVGLAATVEGALKNTPSTIVQEQKPDPKRDNPPPGVVWPASQGVAGGPVLTKRVFLPRVLNNISQATLDAAERPPLRLREFGAPERGVTMRNRIEEGGGNPAWVEMGDRELWENLMYLREIYGAKDENGKPLKIEVTFYSSLELYSRDRSRPKYNPQNVLVIYWDVLAYNPGIYKNGIQVFSYREPDRTLEFRIILPKTLPGKVPTLDSVNKMHQSFMGDMLGVFLSKEDGKPVQAYRNWGGGIEPEKSDFLPYPVQIAVRSSNFFNVSRSALWIRLD